MRPYVFFSVMLYCILAAQNFGFAQTGPPDIQASKTETPAPALVIPLEVRVAAGDPLQDMITDCINRKLHSLGDVAVAEHNPWFRLTIVATQIVVPVQSSDENVRDLPLGIAYSVIVSNLWFPRTLTSLMDTVCQKEVREYHLQESLEYLSEAGMVMDHWVEWAQPMQLGETCERIVDRLKTKSLGPNREQLMRLMQLKESIQD